VKHARIAEEAFAVLGWLLRRIPGGLALATVAACAAFAAVSGSSVATVVSVGQMAIDEMRKHGYSLEVAGGVVGAAGTLGILIPPSVPLVIFGILTGESIGALLIAGILPGILSAVIYGLNIVVRARKYPERYGRAEDVLPAATRPSLRQGATGLLRIALLFTIVIGGMYSGIFTAIEASAWGALAAVIMVIIAWVRSPRELASRLRSTFSESVSINGMIFALLVGGAIFSAWTVAAGIPSSFTNWMLGLNMPGHVLVLLLLLSLIPLGMFLDGFSIMLIMVPISYPLVNELGMSGIWFGILFIKFIEIGVITPPLGVNAFLVAGTTPDMSPQMAFRGVLKFLPLDLATIALIFVFPPIVTWLPDLVRL
jgi:C4-dicarboxylate transporter, DctM subunit